MKEAIQPLKQKQATGKSLLSLSDEEKRALELEFLKELENEHSTREKRAAEKMQRSLNRHLTEKRMLEKQVTAFKSEMRRQFYNEKGYKQGRDPTGRLMWLSPSEQQSNNRRRGKKRKSKLKKNLIENRNSIFLYGGIMLLAILLAIYIVKS